MLSLTKSTLFFLALRKSSKKFTLGGQVKSWVADVTEVFQAGNKAGKATPSINDPPQSLDTDSTLFGTLPSMAMKSFNDQDSVEDVSEIFADIVDNAAEKSATISKFGVNTAKTVQVSSSFFNYIACFKLAGHIVATHHCQFRE